MSRSRGGAGCCDFAHVKPEMETELKKAVLVGQLSHLGGISEIPDVQIHELSPHRGWRTRVRLGVDHEGRAGLRAKSTNRLIVGETCTQIAPQLAAGILGEATRRFTPGAELVAALDSEGTRHLVEAVKPARGRRVAPSRHVVEGTGTAVEHVGGTTFALPATAFWQAHRAAPEYYSARIRQWAKELGHQGEFTAWDLYGGAGLFAPALVAAGARVVSVDNAGEATSAGKRALRGMPVVFDTGSVARKLGSLPKPDLVVLDPPRQGAGSEVIRGIASHAPKLVIHVGCDPATFSRDAAAWAAAGYRIVRLELVNAFPGTHHFETFAALVPDAGAAGDGAGEAASISNEQATMQWSRSIDE